VPRAVPGPQSSHAMSGPPRRDMNLKKPYFRLIAQGTKTVEVRVAYESMKKIRSGMEIVFHSGDEACLTRVRDVRTYSSFDDLLDHEDLRAIGGDLAVPYGPPPGDPEHLDRKSVV